ncbi:hypothetical protein BSL78_18204, partial [Apostichopus japonicus]
IRRFLKDSTASWDDKLKLAKYSWVTDSCYIPNKYQVLVDWCCHAVSTDERHPISESDVAPLWLFLKEILQSKQFAIVGKPITIPAAFYNALHSTLQKEPQYLNDVVQVTKEIFKRPQLSEQCLAKVAASVEVLSCLLHLLRRELETVSNTETELTALVKKALEVFSDKYRFRLIQKKVFEDLSRKTLASCLSLHRQVERPGFKSAIERFLSETIFSTDLLSLYVDFLKRKPETTPSEKKQPQYVSVAMDTLQEILNDSEKHKHEFKDVIDGIPLMFNLFVTSLRPKVDTSFLMLKKLLHLLGFSETKALWDSSDDLRPSVMGSVHLLLKAVIQHDIYKVTDDEAENGKQQVYLKHLTSQVIAFNQWSQPCWFSCLRLLFSIDHKLLEIHQVIALRAVLTEDSNETKELAESKLEFFREVCDTYLKLRQFPKFCDFLIKCCSLESPRGKLMFPARYLAEFGKNIQELPQQTSLGIWTSLRKALANLISDLIIRLKEEQMSEPPSKKKKKRQVVADIESLDDFEGLAALFGCVLRNCKVIEFTSIPQGAQTVRVELQQIVDDMVLPSLNAVVAMGTEDYMPKGLVSFLSGILYVACCYGDVQLLLYNYMNREDSSYQSLEGPLKSREFHHLHNYATQDTWKLVVTACDQAKNERLTFHLNNLVIQQIKLLVLATEPIIGVIKDSLVNLTSGLYTDCRASLSNLSPSRTSINKSKYPAAHLQRLTSNYAILRHYMSEVDRINFATLLSQLLFVHEPLLESGGQHTMLQHDTSGSELAMNFLESDLCMEARDLQSHLLAKAVEVFSSLMTSRPSLQKSQHVPELLTILDNPKDLHLVMKVMSSGDMNVLQGSHHHYVEVFTKFLSALPMALLPPNDQACCLMSLTFLDSLLTRRSELPTDDQLVCLAGIRRLAMECVKELPKSDAISQIDMKAIILELAASHVQLSQQVLSSQSAESVVALLEITQYTTELIFHWLRRERVWTEGSGSIKGLIKKVKSLTKEFVSGESDEDGFGQRSSVIDLTAIVFRFCERHTESVPSNFHEFSQTFFQFLNEFIINIDFSNCSPAIVYTVSSISNFFVSLNEWKPTKEKDVSQNASIQSLQSAWLKAVLQWLPKWKPLTKDNNLSKLLQMATDKCLKLVSTMNEEQLRDAWSCLYLLLGYQEHHLSTDMLGTFKAAVPLMAITEIEQYLIESIKSLTINGGNRINLMAGLWLWQVIPYSQLEESKLAVVSNLIPELISQSMHLMQETSLVRELDGSMIALLFNSLAYIISQGKDLLVEEMLVSSLSLCLLLPLELVPAVCFPAVVQSACRLHVMQRGQQTPVSPIPDEMLIACAEDMERLLTLFASHKEAKQVTCFLVASFFQEMQQGTLLPAFKKPLILGIYNLVDSSDFKSLSLVQRTMPTDLQEVYKSFMGDYYKYHRFKGNI